jgi:two-component system response regulator
MLVLSRNEESAINIGSDIKVKVLSINRQSVKLGVEAPQDIRIWRDELPSTLDEDKEPASVDHVIAGMRMVLVVEDDPGHAQLIRKALCENRGTNVTMAATARNALDALGARVTRPVDIAPPDLIVLDLGLPDGSGLDLLRIIRNVPELRSTPVVVLSCSDDEATVNRCMESGANAFVPKSAGYDDFHVQVSRIGQFWAGDCFARRHVTQSADARPAAVSNDPAVATTEIVSCGGDLVGVGSEKRILVADDDAGHVALIKRALRHAHIDCPVDVVGTGLDVIDYLLRVGRHAKREPANMPDLILLDLNMPEMNGRQVLQTLRATRSQVALKLPPVVVLTSSEEDADINDSYRLGAQSFIRKPADHGRFMLAVQQTTQYWLGLNESGSNTASIGRPTRLPR